MKKRILCLAIALLMVLPMILASCNDIRSDEEIIASILGGEDAPIALTLSLWIPTEADTNDDNFQKRLTAVEDAINEILVEKNYTTKIDIIAVNDSEYEQKLADRFSSMSSIAGPGQAYADGMKYKNEIDYYYPDPNNTEDFIYTLKYPAVTDYQLDLFLIRGYDNFINYYEKNYLSDKIDSYTKAGTAYSNITKLIRPNILNQMKLNGKIYAIPNNHLYADEYQYILVNKSIADSLGYDFTDVEDIYSCEDYITAVGNAIQNGEISNVIPFVGTLEDAPNVSIYDKDAMIGAGFSDGVISDIYASEDYKQYVALYKRLSESGCVGSLTDGDAAVQFAYGTTNEIEDAYGDDYYLIKSTGPVITTDSVYESMFAISSYSIEFERSMKFLYLLQSDYRIRTLIQYGIEGEDYTIEFDSEANENVIKVKEDTAYKMNVLYTGNGYYTYPGDGLGLGAWEDVKETNKDAVVDPFICFDKLLNSDKVSEQEKALLESNKLAVLSLIQNYIDTLNGMSSADFEKFASIDFATIVWEDLAFYKEEMGYEKEDMLGSLEDDYKDLNKKLSKIVNNEELSQEDKDAQIKEIEYQMALISAALREVLNYRVSDKETQKIIDKYNAEIAELNKEIENIQNNEEMDAEDKEADIADIQEEIDELNNIISFYSLKRSEAESEAKVSVVKGIIDYLNAELEALKAESEANESLIADYEALVSYLSNEIADELGLEYVVLSDEELIKFFDLIPDLNDFLDDVYDDIDNSTELSNSEIDAKLSEIDKMIDYLALLEDLKDYEIFINEFLADIDETLKDTVGFEFVVELYDSEEYKYILDFYASLTKK